jgi:hypothetical protein
MRISALVSTLVVLGLAGCSTSGEPDLTPQQQRYGNQQYTVYLYCSYGAVSKAQFNGCYSHLTQRDVLSARPTNAVRYATGHLDQCLADSGPLCKPIGSGAP